MTAAAKKGFPNKKVHKIGARPRRPRFFIPLFSCAREKNPFCGEFSFWAPFCVGTTFSRARKDENQLVAAESRRETERMVSRGCSLCMGGPAGGGGAAPHGRRRAPGTEEKIRKYGRLPLGQLLPRQFRAPRASARADGRREAAARRHMLRAPGAGRLAARREGTAAGAGTATVAQRASGGGHAGVHAAGKHADEDGRGNIEQRFDENLFFKHFLMVFCRTFFLLYLLSSK